MEKQQLDTKDFKFPYFPPSTNYSCATSDHSEECSNTPGDTDIIFPEHVFHLTVIIVVNRYS